MLGWGSNFRPESYDCHGQLNCLVKCPSSACGAGCGCYCGVMTTVIKHSKVVDARAKGRVRELERRAQLKLIGCLAEQNRNIQLTQ